MGTRYDANIICRLMWHVWPEVVPGQNAPQGVEKVHYECRIDIESIDEGGGGGVLKYCKAL